jgi:predicted enzyme related to lactoylglutathione lyase
MGRPVVHWELWSKDPQGVADFYARVFDWKVNYHPGSREAPARHLAADEVAAAA